MQAAQAKVRAVAHTRERAARSQAAQVGGRQAGSPAGTGRVRQGMSLVAGAEMLLREAVGDNVTLPKSCPLITTWELDGVARAEPQS